MYKYFYSEKVRDLLLIKTFTNDIPIPEKRKSLNSKRLEISPKNGWRARARLPVAIAPGDCGQVAGEPMTSFPNWRRGWDSNPRSPYELNALAVRCFRPLSHLSQKIIPTVYLLQTNFQSDSKFFSSIAHLKVVFPGKSFCLC